MLLEGEGRGEEARTRRSAACTPSLTPSLTCPSYAFFSMLITHRQSLAKVADTFARFLHCRFILAGDIGQGAQLGEHHAEPLGPGGS